MKEYAIYLRKSRADMEAEARGEGETLARHRTALVKLANDRGYHIAEIYAEVVSGDTIAARPQMQALLAAVQRGEYAGVICNDIDRLSRGDMTDQSVVFGSFASTGTLIITPAKVYDPTNDADSDFFDMSLFMARFEYRQIKRRMEAGRIRAASEGNWQAGPRPYGYTVERRKDKSGYTLVPVEQEADVVRMIFDWYGNEGVGRYTVAARLNRMGIPTSTGGQWVVAGIYHILRNRVYVGEMVWRKYKITKSYDSSGKHTHKEKRSDPIIASNAFPPIVDRKLFDRVQTMLDSHAAPAIKSGVSLTNPFAGLLKCSVCGKTMRYHDRGTGYTVSCPTAGCPTWGISADCVERSILDGLKGWVIEYEHTQTEPLVNTARIETDAINRQLATLDGQMSRLHDLLEQGIYSPQEYIQRRDTLRHKIDYLKQQLESVAHKPTMEDAVSAILPEIHTVLDAYPYLTDASEKNKLLKSILAKVEYSKTKRCGRGEPNPAKYLTLTLYPRIVRK